MQTLPIISINLWEMLYALLNLLILYLLVKKFLYQPVKKMLSQRQATIDNEYKEAEEAKQKALSDKQTYEEKLSGAEAEADSLIQSAVQNAGQRELEILAEAKEKADGIRRQAEADAALELKKAEQTIREEIVNVGTLLAGKMLEREMNAEDHKKLIDALIDEIGDEYEGH
ncbi:MAG: F0F1 ATP synthase subunit B [Clostridia bacterium]|nr:F0F1 ATP synthase subunit B [Clostridia bacterium]